MSKRWNTVGPYIPYDLLQTKGETSAKFNGDRFRNVDFYRVQTQEADKKEQKAISALYIRRFYTTQRGCLTQKIFTQFQLPYYYWYIFCIYCPYLIYKDVCFYVSLYLIQMHISEPIGTKLCTHLPRGLEESVGYVWAHNISPFPLFRPISSGARASSYAVHGRRRHTAPLLRYIRGAARAGVTSGTVGCAMKTRRSERNACV